MRQFIGYFILLLFLSTGLAKSQVAATDTPRLLEDLFDRLVGNYNDADRIHINDSIRLILDDYVKSDSVFTHRFINLRYLGQIVSPDSSLKIITWNLVLENEPGKYFCYFIKKQDSVKENRIYRLSVGYNGNPVHTDTTYTGPGWYGALYYDIRPYIINNSRCWILLGIDFGNSDISRKIIEVLTFSPEDSIVFGRKWFVSGEEKAYRAVFEYASNAMMSLKFKSDSSIVFDHLVPFSSAHKDDHQYYGPDYSFDAYNFENGFWKLILNVDARNEE
jgi:hypothetical protein